MGWSVRRGPAGGDGEVGDDLLAHREVGVQALRRRAARDAGRDALPEAGAVVAVRVRTGEQGASRGAGAGAGEAQALKTQRQGEWWSEIGQARISVERACEPAYQRILVVLGRLLLLRSQQYASRRQPRLQTIAVVFDRATTAKTYLTSFSLSQLQLLYFRHLPFYMIHTMCNYYRGCSQDLQIDSDLTSCLGPVSECAEEDGHRLEGLPPHEHNKSNQGHQLFVSPVPIRLHSIDFLP